MARRVDRTARTPHDEGESMSAEDMLDAVDPVVDYYAAAERWPWTVGVDGRTIWATWRDSPGFLVGIMDTNSLSTSVVHAHNRTIGVET